MSPDTAAQPPYGIRPEGFRLPDATHVGRVRLQVDDLSRSIDFYTRVIGLRVVVSDADTAVLAPHDDDRPLVELRAKPGIQPVPHRGAVGLFHFAILLPDRAALGRFIPHLVNSGTRFGAADHHVSEALYVHDPDGLGIEVYADRPRETWRHEGRELTMGTDPLDLSGPVDASHGEGWSGAPAGTTMGHMHLHVGNLEEAQRFYHEVLGFDVTVWHYPGARFFSAGGYHHHLGTNTWATGVADPNTHACLLEWELVVPEAPDAAAAAASLRAAGYAAEQDGEAWMVADPWGTRFRVRPS